MKQTNDSLTDLLAVILIGVIGGFIAFLGLYLDTTVIYLVGTAILVCLVFVTAAEMFSSIVEFISTIIRAILHFKNYFRNKHSYRDKHP